MDGAGRGEPARWSWGRSRDEGKSLGGGRGDPRGRGWQPCSAGSPQPHSESLPGAAALARVHSQARGPEGLFLDLLFFLLLIFFFPLLSFSAVLEALGREENTDPRGGKLRGRALEWASAGVSELGHREFLRHSRENPLAPAWRFPPGQPAPAPGLPFPPLIWPVEGLGSAGSRAGAGQAQGKYCSSRGERLPSMEISSCTAGTEETPSASAEKGEQKHPKKAQDCSHRGLQQSSAPPSPQHMPLQARTCPSPSRVGKIPAPGPQLHPKPARILPAWEMRPGRGLKHPTPFPQENTQDHRKSHSSLWVYFFFFGCISYIIQFHILIGSAIIEQLILKSFNTSETAMVR